MFKKGQKTITHISQEIYDVDFTMVQCERLHAAYTAFYAKISDEDRDYLMACLRD